MKRTVKTLALVAVLGLLAIGCHDDPVTPTPTPTVRKVNYTACGEQQSATVTSDDEWHTLLDRLFEAVDEGCTVTFWNPDANSAKSADTVTISTADRQQAYRWGEEMYDQGYIVSIVYDENTGTYLGTAIKSVFPISDYTPIPLVDYLPGTWVIDTTGPWHLYFANWPTGQWDTIPDMNYTWHETLLDYTGTYFDPAIFQQEIIQFTDNNLITPYPGEELPYSDYYALGYFDSTMVYNYTITNNFTIHINSCYPTYGNPNIPSHMISDNMYIIQVSNDYMILYGYTPRFFLSPMGIMTEAFGFVRQ